MLNVNVCETLSNECTMMTFTTHIISVARDRNGLFLYPDQVIQIF